ncbi:hypothetical protein HDV05_000581, partial [Chytridiales sp. JEL 0842]
MNTEPELSARVETLHPIASAEETEDVSHPSAESLAETTKPVDTKQDNTIPEPLAHIEPSTPPPPRSTSPSSSKLESQQPRKTREEASASPPRPVEQAPLDMHSGSLSPARLS